MVTSAARTPEEYIASLPDDRREAVRTVAQVVRDNLPDGYREGMAHGMIGWFVPLETFPDTYNGQPLGLASLASQKQYISLYLNNVYWDRETEAWFRQRCAETGKPLHMGKSCVRFRRVDDIPLEVIGKAIARTDVDSLLRQYQAALRSGERP